MHPSWLFPGASKNNYRQPSDATSGDARSTIINNNNVVGFELNSFVRSLNRNGIQLPEAFMHKTGNNINNKDKNSIKNERGDGNAGKSLNDFLSLMNDSVDRVLDQDSKNNSDDSSSISTFRSFHGQDKESTWNDLIHLVSTTAHEFRDISKTGNENTNDTRRNISNSSVNSTRILDIDTRKLLHSRLIKSRENEDENIINESTKIGLDVTPTNDNVFTHKLELVESYSDVQSSDFKSSLLDAESLEKMSQFETPRCFFNEILRISKGKDGFSGNSSCTKADRNSSAWLSSKRRMNFEEEMWPIGFGVARNNDFSPYFTGAPAKPFKSRPIERDVWSDPRKRVIMNPSRSSPIFTDAGETTAESLEITLPTRDSENCEEKIHNEIIRSIRNKEASIDQSNCPVRIDEEKKIFVASSKNDDTRKTRVSTKLLVKRGRKIRKHTSRKNGRKRCLAETENEEETSGKDVNFITSSLPSSARSPMQRFFQESCRVVNDDERVDFTENKNLIESQIGTSLKIRPRNFTNNSSKRFIKAANRHSEIIVSEMKTNPNFERIAAIESPKERSTKTIEDRVELNNSSTRTDRSLVGSNQFENRRNTCEKERGNNREKPIWKPAGSVKIVSSSISAVPKKSRIATLITPQSARQNVVKSSTISPISTARNHKNSAISCEKLQGEMPIRSTEIIVDAQTSRSKQRSEIFNKSSKTRIPEYSRSQNESQARARTANSSSSRGGSIDRDELSANEKQERTNFKTTIPILRSKTFDDQTRRDSNLKNLPSKENCSKKIIGKKNSSASSSQGHRQFDSTSNANFQDSFDSRVSTEMSRTDIRPGSRSNCINNNVRFSSNDSVTIKKIITTSVSGQTSRSVERTDEERNIKEEKTREKMESRKFYNKHERSLLMLKSILSHQGVNVDGINRNPSGIKSKIWSESTNKSNIPISSPLERSSTTVQTDKSNPNVSGTSKTLFEKLAKLTECRTDRSEYADRADSCDRSFSSFVDLASDSITSCDRSMKDAGEQCSIDNYESSVVSRTSIVSNRSSCCSKDRQEETTLVSDVFTETGQDHDEIICVDIGLSPTPSMADIEMKFFQAAQTQTRSNLLDKDSITEETFRQIAECSDNFTETEEISLATKEVSTDFWRPECIDATLQIDLCKITKDAISGNDSSDLRCTSRGVCFRGPRKIDGNSQVVLGENSREIASGKDYVELYSVTEEINTDRQDYLYVDRSVNILIGPKSVDNSCQFESRLKNVDIAVGEFSLDKRETRSSRNEKLFGENVSRDVEKMETVVVKDVDVVQWKSSTNFEASRYNCGSLCSSSSSLMIYRPIMASSRGSSLEKFRENRLSDRLPKEAIVALEIANERAQNFYRAIEIYRENLTARKTKKETCLKIHESMEISLLKNNFKSVKKSIESPSSKRCSFRDNSTIKSLLKANLERSCIPRCLEANNEISSELNSNDENSPNIQQEITILMKELVADLVRNIETERHVQCQNFGKIIVSKERFLRSTKNDNSLVREENFQHRKINDENILTTNEKTSSCFFLSRNSLLTFVYGTLCSLVFWALQFSITCDSL